MTKIQKVLTASILLAFCIGAFFHFTPTSEQQADVFDYGSPNTQFRQTENPTLSPYAMFGDSSVVLMTEEERIGKQVLTIPNKKKKVSHTKMDFNLRTGQVWVYDDKGEVKENFTLPSEILARFIGVDPIAGDFPHVSPYNYAENSPIANIDLWGLQAFSIHGTTETRDRFTNSAINELTRIAGNSVVDRSFSWDAGITNNPTSRQQAATDLVSHVKSVRQNMISAGTITADEHISFIGYSHGGNVGIQAAEMLAAEGIEVNLITVSTPAATSEGLAQMEQEYQSSFPMGGSTPGPANFDGYRSEIPGGGINEHLQIVHENDRVVNIASGGRGASFGAPATNMKVPNSSVPINSFPTSIMSHINLPNHPKFDDYLKTIPTMSKPKGN